MTELTTSELNIFFNESGEITMGGGLHMKVILSGAPTVKIIQALVDRIHEYRDSQPEPDETAQAARGQAPKPEEEDSPRCQAKGVWAPAKGNYKEGFRKDWRHNAPRMNKKGELYCPTPINKDEDELAWCGWRAVEREDGTWEEWDAGDHVKDELPFE